jgi:thiamine biosynthesis lipoprotein
VDDSAFEFPCMGVRVELRIAPPRDPSGPDPQRSAATARAALDELDRTLTRFSDDSELSRLNADPRRVVPASPTLRAAVRAALEAAQASRGLVDPTLLGPLRRAGYASTMRDVASAPLRDALATAPPRRVAAAHPARAWTRVEVDDAAGTITRPPGIGLDLGGSAKGLAADLVARALQPHRRFLVDMAGDLAIGRTDPSAATYSVGIVEPFDDRVVHEIEIAGGGIATSGVGSRLWTDGNGGHAHHLLDPATGEPAWTGVVMATALAPTTLQAETLAKQAVLGGPAIARRLLARQGGLLVLDDGSVELLGRFKPRVRLRMPGALT